MMRLSIGNQKASIARRCKIAIAAIALCGMSTSVEAALINEFQPNPTGADPTEVSVELIGTPGTSFMDFFLIALESDGANGAVDRLSNAFSGTFDSNGLFVTMIPDLENPSFTFLLAQGATVALGTDLDVDNDGVIDADLVSSLGTVLDAINVPDSAADASAVTYASQFGGTDFAFTGTEPQLIFRDGVTGELFAINDPAGTEAFRADGSTISFDAFSSDPSVPTFGSANPTAIPEPSTYVALSLIAVGGLVARRRRAAAKA